MRLHPGEVEAGGWRVQSLAELVDDLRQACPSVEGRPRVVAVDGRGGSGKSVLARRLREVVAASAVVHTDDVAWNHACFDWGREMAENILAPLNQGHGVDFSPQPWVEHARAGAISVAAGLDVVWVEGTGIIREELTGWIDASIYLQGDLDVQEDRVLARDGNAGEVREQVARWMEEELPFLAREQPWARATVVVASASDLVHDPRTEVVVARPTPR